MSTTIENTLTPTQRTNEAVHQVSIYLGLSDTKVLAVALAEAALADVQYNPSFAAHVRMLYEGMVAKAKPAPRRRSQQAAPDVELVPRKNVQPREANPGTAPDAYYLFELYGEDQLPLALARYKVPELQLAAKLVQQRNPGAKLSSKRTRDALITYIVEHVRS